MEQVLISRLKEVLEILEKQCELENIEQGFNEQLVKSRILRELIREQVPNENFDHPNNSNR